MRKEDIQIGMKVWILDGGRKKETTVLEFTADGKGVYTASSRYVNNRPLKCYQLFEEVYADEHAARNGEHRWDRNYDDYVDPLRVYH